MTLTTLKAAILLSFIENTRTNIFVYIDGIDPNPMVIDQNELDIMDPNKNVGDLYQLLTTHLQIQDTLRLNLQIGDAPLSDLGQSLADAGIGNEAAIHGMIERIEITLTIYQGVRPVTNGIEVQPSFDLRLALGQDIFDALRHQKPDTVPLITSLIDMTLNSTRWYYPVSGNALSFNRVQSFENAELLLIPEGQERSLQRLQEDNQYNSTNCNDRGTFKARDGRTAVLIIYDHVTLNLAPAPNGYEFFLRPKVARARRLLSRTRFN